MSIKIEYNSKRKIFELKKNNKVIFQCLTKEEAVKQKKLLNGTNKAIIGFGKWGIPGYILKVGTGNFSVKIK